MQLSKLNRWLRRGYERPPTESHSLEFFRRDLPGSLLGSLRGSLRGYVFSNCI